MIIKENGLNEIENKEDLKQIIKELKEYNLRIQFIGSWIWIDGNTYKAKNILKKYSFRFNKVKKAWYFKLGGFENKIFRNYYKNLNEIPYIHEELKQEVLI